MSGKEMAKAAPAVGKEAVNLSGGAFFFFFSFQGFGKNVARF